MDYYNESVQLNCSSLVINHPLLNTRLSPI
jgi:hypothetical protein